MRQLLVELHVPVSRVALVYCDNISTIYMSANLFQHQRTKHVEIGLHFVREWVAIGVVRVLRVPISLQYANIFTRGMPSSVFMEFKSSHGGVRQMYMCVREEPRRVLRHR